MCVSEWVEDGEKGQRALGMLCIQQIERQSRGEKGAWHSSYLSDGSCTGLRHGLSLISLSLDMKMEEKQEQRVAEGTKAQTFTRSYARSIFTLLLLF